MNSKSSFKDYASLWLLGKLSTVVCRWSSKRGLERCVPGLDVNVPARQEYIWQGCCWFQNEQAHWRHEHLTMMKIILLGYIFYLSLKVNTTSSKMCESLIHYLFLSEWLNPTLLDIFCRLSSLVSSPWLEIFSMFPWRLLVDKTSYYLSPRGCSWVWSCCNSNISLLQPDGHGFKFRKHPL